MYWLQIRYWRQHEREAAADRVRTAGLENTARVMGLRPNTLYHVIVLAYNSAGTGPPSPRTTVITKKPRKTPLIPNSLLYIFTFMHSADVITQSNLQCILVIHFVSLSLRIKLPNDWHCKQHSVPVLIEKQCFYCAPVLQSFLAHLLTTLHLVIKTHVCGLILKKVVFL